MIRPTNLSYTIVILIHSNLIADVDIDNIEILENRWAKELSLLSSIPNVWESAQGWPAQISWDDILSTAKEDVYLPPTPINYCPRTELYQSVVRPLPGVE